MTVGPASRPPSRITVICGGVGAARFLRALTSVVDPERVTAVINVADDMVLHGLAISPDIDTVTYTLAEAIDPDRGWGLRNETWHAMEALGRYGDRNWFSLGDQDIATHLQRTARLAEGATLTEVTREIADAWGVRVTLLPVTNDRVSTRVTIAATNEEIGFQEYFVGRQHDVAISSVRFDGIEAAEPTPEVLAAITSADPPRRRPIESDRVDRSRVERAVDSRGAHAPNSPVGRDLADRRWRSAQGPGCEDVEGTRPRGERSGRRRALE